MQAALRSASRRAAGAASRRGVAAATTTTELNKEWIESVVQREVRAQMLAAEERSALLRAKEAEWSAGRRADKLEVEAPCKWLTTWRKGFLVGYFSCFTGGVLGTLIYKR